MSEPSQVGATERTEGTAQGVWCQAWERGGRRRKWRVALHRGIHRIRPQKGISKEQKGAQSRMREGPAG